MKRSKKVLGLLLAVAVLFSSSLTGLAAGSSVSAYQKITYNGISTGRYEVDGRLAFCLEYDKATPARGTAVSMLGEISNAGVRAALWFGYGGPAQYGFSSTEQAILLTALLASYYYSGQMAFSSVTSPKAQSTGFTAFYNYVQANSGQVPSSFHAYAVDTNANMQDLGWSLKNEEKQNSLKQCHQNLVWLPVH